MTTTTGYGTWVNHGDTSNSSVEGTIADYMSGGDREWRERMEAAGACEAIAADYRAAVNGALPAGVSLAGNEFYGPYHDEDCDWDGELGIAGIIESIDLGAIVERHDVDNAVLVAYADAGETYPGDEEDEAEVPQVTVADVRALLDAPHERPVMYVKAYDEDGDALDEPVIDVWAAGLVPGHAVIVHRCDLIDAIGDDADDYDICEYLPVLQDSVAAAAAFVASA